jgi:hypothetical protein
MSNQKAKMSDLKTLIQENDLGLSKTEVQRLLSINGKQGLAPLSPDKEQGLFLLYASGYDIDAIAAKTNWPKDVIMVTAINYKWATKARILITQGNVTNMPLFLQKELVNSVLIATFVSYQKELGEVIAGKRQAKDCALIPSSQGSLEKLINLVSSVNGAAPPPDKPTTVVHAQNVQINQGSETKEPPKEPPKLPEDPKRAEMLAELDED